MKVKLLNLNQVKGTTFLLSGQAIRAGVEARRNSPPNPQKTQQSQSQQALAQNWWLGNKGQSRSSLNSKQFKDFDSKKLVKDISHQYSVKEYSYFRSHGTVFHASHIGQVHQTKSVKSLKSDTKMTSVDISQPGPLWWVRSNRLYRTSVHKLLLAPCGGSAK